jgi:hypothetical protein
MQTQPFNPFALFFTGCNSLVQYAAGGIVKLAEVRGDFSTYQKASLAALAWLREINYQNNTKYLPKFATYLANASSLDFYGFCRIPYYFICTYTADQIDDQALFSDLKKALYQNWEVQGENEQVDSFAKEQLRAFLEEMQDKDVGFSTADQFKASLKKWLVNALESTPIQNFDPQKIDLTTLEIPFAKKSWLGAIIDHIYLAVDMACVPSFLDGWDLIELGPYAKTIGKFPLLSWVPEHSLDDWIWGGAALGNFLQLIVSLDNQWNENLKPKQKKNEMWLTAVSAAEAFYCYSNTQRNWHPRTINTLALIAKSIGLVASLVSEPSSYLDDDEI